LECEDTNGSTAEINCGGSCEIGIYERKAKLNFDSSIQQDNKTFLRSEGSMETKTGMIGVNSEVKLGGTLFRVHDKCEDADLKLVTASAEASSKIDKDGIKDMVRVGINLVESEYKGLKSKIGINLDTGFSVDKNGVEVKFEGLGFKVGKEIGVSTPLGEVSVDLG
ncbi:17307_t:CDS:1, partial [Cetraspora pellucida]